MPQYVLEAALEGTGPLPNIIVTEPRRISAVRAASGLGLPRGRLEPTVGRHGVVRTILSRTENLISTHERW